MKSAKTITLNNGNKRHTGRQGENKLKKAIDLIGEENLRTIVEMHLQTALNDEDSKLRASCQAFLIDRFVPKTANISHQSYLKIPLLPMGSIENIKQNEDIVLKNMCEGSISLEVGKELFSMIEQGRKTYETTEMARMLMDMDQRMKEQGI